MSKVLTKIYEHEGKSIELLFSETVYFNATVAAKAFGKRTNDWLRLKETTDYIEALIRSQKCYVAGIVVSEQNQLVRIVNGGEPKNQGTWLHQKLIVPFARWLNPDFAVWCDEIIFSMLSGKQKEDKSFDVKDIDQHINRAIQVENSKQINSFMFERGGKYKIIAYNQENCRIRCGQLPNEVIKAGKVLGLKSSERTSAKEVFRKTSPEKACGMSLADKLILSGGDETKSLALSVKAQEIFKGMIELGVIPSELLR